MSTHTHRAQPTRRTIDIGHVTARGGRTYCIPGDPAIIEDWCGCGAVRRTPAVMSAPEGYVEGRALGSQDAKAIDAPGAWVGGAL